MWEAWGGFLHASFNDLSNWFTNLGVNISNWFTNLITNLGEWFKSVGQWFADLGTNISSWFTNLITNLGEWFKSVGQWFVNLGDTIADWFGKLFEWFEHNFTISFDEIKETYDFETLLHDKFKVLFDVTDKVQSATGVMTANQAAVTALSDTEHGGVGGSYDPDYNFSVDTVIQISLPIAGENRTYTILDLTEPHLLKLFRFCRTFLNYTLWLGLGYAIIRRITRNLSI